MLQVTNHAKELIDKHANEYLDSEEAAHKRDKEGLKSALDKHEALKEKAVKKKNKPGQAPASESDFDSPASYGDTAEDDSDNPLAETEKTEET